jgi:hypothetical protein
VIPALTLCAHLAAAHGAANCHGVPGPGNTASFDTPTGEHGLVSAFTDAQWERMSRNPGGELSPNGRTPWQIIKARAEAPPVGKRIEALFAHEGTSFADSPSAHVVIVVGGAMPERATWWIGAIENQATLALAARRDEASIVREKANPSGVVNLYQLHEDGAALARERSQLAANADVYKRVTGLDVPVLP